MMSDFLIELSDHIPTQKLIEYLPSKIYNESWEDFDLRITKTLIDSDLKTPYFTVFYSKFVPKEGKHRSINFINGGGTNLNHALWEVCVSIENNKRMRFLVEKKFVSDKPNVWVMHEKQQ